MDSDNLSSPLFFGVAFIAYFLPAFIAALRKHHQQNAIVVLNLLLGWTGVGWIGALVWASTAKKPVDAA